MCIRDRGEAGGVGRASSGDFQHALFHRQGGVVSFITWGGEARKIAKTQPTYGNIRLSAKRLEAIVPQTHQARALTKNEKPSVLAQLKKFKEIVAAIPKDIQSNQTKTEKKI